MRVAGTSDVNPKANLRPDTPEPRVVTPTEVKKIIQHNQNQASAGSKDRAPAASDENVINNAVGSTTIAVPGRRSVGPGPTQRGVRVGKGYEPADLLKGIQEKNMDIVRHPLLKFLIFNIYSL